MVSWDWLKGGILKKETEGLLTAAQDQALQTNYIKKKIDRQDVLQKIDELSIRNSLYSAM